MPGFVSGVLWVWVRDQQTEALLWGCFTNYNKGICQGSGLGCSGMGGRDHQTDALMWGCFTHYNKGLCQGLCLGCSGEGSDWSPAVRVLSKPYREALTEAGCPVVAPGSGVAILGIPVRLVPAAILNRLGSPLETPLKSPECPGISDKLKTPIWGLCTVPTLENPPSGPVIWLLTFPVLAGMLRMPVELRKLFWLVIKPPRWPGKLIPGSPERDGPPLVVPFMKDEGLVVAALSAMPVVIPVWAARKPTGPAEASMAWARDWDCAIRKWISSKLYRWALLGGEVRKTREERRLAQAEEQQQHFNQQVTAKYTSMQATEVSNTKHSFSLYRVQ